MNFSKLLSANFGDRRIPQTLEATFRRKVDYSEPQGREVRPGNRCGNNMDTPWEEIRRWGRRPNRVSRRRSSYRYHCITPRYAFCDREEPVKPRTDGRSSSGSPFISAPQRNRRLSRWRLPRSRRNSAAPAPYSATGHIEAGSCRNYINSSYH